jgi:hypothetical protein
MQERFEVYEVQRHIKTQTNELYVEWTLVFTCETKEAIGTGMVQQSEDARAALPSLRSSFIPPHYAVYDVDEDWWISGPADPLIGYRRGQDDGN